MTPRCFFAGLLLAPALATAAPRDDYAVRWPLELRRTGAGAYQVMLEPEVYDVMHDPAGRDVDIIGADGVPVPSMLLPPPQPALAIRRISVPYFPLPVLPSGTAEPGLLAETDASGRLRRVELRGVTGVPGMPDQALLLDLSTIEHPIRALDFAWSPSGAVDRAYTVESSDDLQNWTLVPARGRLVDLSQNGRRLLQRSLGFDAPVRARYLRLSPPGDGSRVHVHRVDAVVHVPTAAAVRRRALVPLPGKSDRRFLYRVAGRTPVIEVDAELPGNTARDWLLESRDGADAPWQPRARWSAFRIEQDGQVRRSPPRQLPAPVRDREWRLTSTGGPVQAMPALRLGHRAESIVFLAQGNPPFSLVAGSARVRRSDAPVAALLDDLRKSNGPGWRPAAARLGPPARLAGDDALRPERDWKSWLLWAVLGAGVLVVAGFALRLLRENTPGEG